MADSGRPEAYAREAQVLASLSHPNIAAICGNYDESPLWFPEGSRVVFRSTRNGKVGRYQRVVEG